MWLDPISHLSQAHDQLIPDTWEEEGGRDSKEPEERKPS